MVEGGGTKTLSSFTKELAKGEEKIIFWQWHETKEGIARVAEDYFQELFTTSNLTTIEPMVENVDRVVTPLMNHQLLQPYTKEEVK